MTIGVRASELHEIELLRENYRAEMNCQIIHDSIHARPGWTREFALYDDGALIGYGSVAVAGPWRDNPALYEFFIDAQHRMRTFEAFTTLLPTCGAKIIETQSNDPFQTSFQLHGTCFRAAEKSDAPELRRLELDEDAGWVVAINGEIAGAGG